MDMDSFNIGSSLFKALDFSVEVDDDDLFPAEDLKLKSGKMSSSKLKGGRMQKSNFNIFDNTRKSNPS